MEKSRWLKAKNVLTTACTRRQRAVYKLLFETLSGTEHEGCICAGALSAAMQSRDDDMVRLLLEHGLTLIVETLCQARAAGLENVARMLLVNRIDVDGDDGTGAFPLHVASSYSHPAVVQLLIEQGANVNLSSTNYGSALIREDSGIHSRFQAGFGRVIPGV